MKQVIKVIGKDLYVYKERNTVRLGSLEKATLYNTKGSASIALKSNNCKFWLNHIYQLLLQDMEVRSVTILLNTK